MKTVVKHTRRITFPTTVIGNSDRRLREIVNNSCSISTAVLKFLMPAPCADFSFWFPPSLEKSVQNLHSYNNYTLGHDVLHADVSV